MKRPSRLFLSRFALASVMAAGVAGVLVANAEEVSPTAAVMEEGAGTAINPAEVHMTAGMSTEVSPLQAQLQPVPAWPEAGAEPQFPLLDYTGVAETVRGLMPDKYEAWLAYLGTEAATQTLPQNLLQATGCMEPCDMRKALLIVNSAKQEAYVAMVEEGRVLMRPSLMSWPDEAIAPLKKWLANGGV